MELITLSEARQRALIPADIPIPALFSADAPLEEQLSCLSLQMTAYSSTVYDAEPSLESTEVTAVPITQSPSVKVCVVEGSRIIGVLLTGDRFLQPGTRVLLYSCEVCEPGSVYTAATYGELVCQASE